MPKKYIVYLSEAERETLTEVIKKGTNAAKIRRAYMLLGADESVEGKQMSDEAIAQAFSVRVCTVERLRQRLVEEGFEVALNAKTSHEPKWRKIDGEAEAHLLALSRSPVPDGHADWTLRLLAEKMVALDYIDSISHESVRQVLKKTNCKSTNG